MCPTGQEKQAWYSHKMDTNIDLFRKMAPNVHNVSALTTWHFTNYFFTNGPHNMDPYKLDNEEIEWTQIYKKETN